MSSNRATADGNDLAYSRRLLVMIYILLSVSDSLIHEGISASLQLYRKARASANFGPLLGTSLQ